VAAAVAAVVERIVKFVVAIQAAEQMEAVSLL
jgi:hypothetical protein